MKGKNWSDYQKAGYIEVDGTRWSLAHLQDQSCTVVTPEAPGKPAVTLMLKVEFSSHCISKGPKRGKTIDFNIVGHERLVIDHRSKWRTFNEKRYHLSLLLPAVFNSLRDRPCLFTGHENFLTLDCSLAGYPPDTEYEIYFSVRKTDQKNTLRIIVESAYIRDDDADNAPVHFKKEDRITGWKMLLKKARGEAIKRPPNKGKKN